MQDELLRWFEREGMLRYRIESDETGNVVPEPQPRQWQRPETHEEMVERLVAEEIQRERES